MPTIAIVDDDLALARSLRTSMNLARPVGWRVEVHPPLSDAHQYPEWIRANDIWALVLDWHLDEKAENGKGVNYRADAVIEVIRGTPWLKGMPIYIATSYAGLPFEHKAGVDAFLDRDEFAEDASTHTERIKRAATRYLEAHADAVAQFDKLSLLVAEGKATPDQVEKLRVVHTYLRLDAIEEFPSHYRYILDDAERVVAELESLIAEVTIDVEKDKESSN